MERFGGPLDFTTSAQVATQELAGLSRRVQNALIRSGIRTKLHLRACSNAELVAIGGIDQMELREIRSWMRGDDYTGVPIHQPMRKGR